MSDYIVSARKYRPDSFETLIGQDSIAQTLKNSITRGQLAHAYLFCGPRGVGKTSTARIFAKIINCANPGPDMEPCGECESCQSFAEGRSYCIHELDAASNNGVEDIKALMEQVQIPPQVGHYSVYIIDEVHMLSTAAFNAFLKTLEEPPAHAVFILCTTEKYKIPATILSRCQTYDFNRISVAGIVSNLRSIAAKESIRIDDGALHVIATKADGAMRDALTIFDQMAAFCGSDIKYEDVRRSLNVLDYEYGFRLVDCFLAKDYATALLILDEILAKGFNAMHFVSSLGEHLRDLLVSRSGGIDSLLDLPDSLKKQYADQAARCSVKFLFDALSIVAQCEAGYKAAVNQRLHIEFSLMRLAFLGGVPESAVAATPAPAPAPVESPKPETPASEPAPAPAPATVAPTLEPAPAPAETPKPEVPAPEPAPAPATTPAPAEKPAPAEEPAPVQAPAPVEVKKPKSGPVKKSSSLSLESLMDDEEDIMNNVDEIEGDSLPGDDAIKEAWNKLAGTVASSPRLATTLQSAKIEIEASEDKKNLRFFLVNEAQVKWIEEKVLKNLQKSFNEFVASSKVFLLPDVIPAEQQEVKIYMPKEKAEDLMNKNEEVKNFVKDLALDIK